MPLFLAIEVSLGCTLNNARATPKLVTPRDSIQIFQGTSLTFSYGIFPGPSWDYSVSATDQ